MLYSTGYGHIAPATTGGRIACMLYSIIGIPLCLIVLADIGKSTARKKKSLKLIISFDFQQVVATSPQLGTLNSLQNLLKINNFALFDRLWPHCPSYNRRSDCMYVILYHRYPIMPHCTHRLYYNHFTLYPRWWP